MATCSIEGCAKKVHSRGWCPRHYWRWHRHGDPLGGGTGDGEPAAFLDEAMAKETDDCIFWPYGTAGRGYAVMSTEDGQRFVSRVVCERVYGPAPSSKHEAAHSCGKGHLACINRKHLRWATIAENHADKLIHDTHNRGERHGLAKLTADKVKTIRDLSRKLSHSKIAKQVGVSRSQVTRVVKGECWGWLQ